MLIITFYAFIGPFRCFANNIVNPYYKCIFAIFISSVSRPFFNTIETLNVIIFDLLPMSCLIQKLYCYLPVETLMKVANLH